VAVANAGHPLIEDYALIGDMHTAALVSRYGSVDWLCLPRFDSDAVFACLLGDSSHGCWRLAPAAADTEAARWRYQGDTLILETTWRTEDGEVVVTDFMPPRADAAATGETPPALIRIVEGVSGAVLMETEIRLRFGYGRVVPWVHKVDDAVHAIAGPDSVWLESPIPLEGSDHSHRATFTVRAGQRVPFALTWLPSHIERRPARIDPAQALRQTAGFWTDWAGRCSYAGPYADAVIRSLITIKALTFAPTGGIVAAATTSLPEAIGGVRNWDYRYCWLRDATIVLEALLRTGYTDEAAAWRGWLGRAIAGNAEDIQIMYGVAGERRLAEWTADWLPGYEGSAPVRVGNGAVGQRQLDVYGEVIDAFMLGGRAGLRFDRHTVALIDGLVEFCEQHWDEPDEGIWEVRGPRRHFVHSKVMAWVAFDRRIKLAEAGLADCDDDAMRRWRQARAAIHAQVCDQGYDQGLGTFTQYYGGTALDAAVLLIADVGFLPPDDKRVVSTVRAIQRDLMRDGFVLRYSTGGAGQAGSAAGSVDGLPGIEGAFLACSFWLVNALHLIGEPDEARELFDKLLGLRNDVGLLSEEYDPVGRRQVGNTPQAFSHVPLIQAALNLAGHEPGYNRRALPGSALAPDGEDGRG
jgi:GH15 family glucan-1,4-alpha-glucosidase